MAHSANFALTALSSVDRVREAGLTHDPEEAALLENDKARADLWRTMTFLDTALLAGISATVAFLQELRDVLTLKVAVVADLAGLTFSLFVLMIATIVVGGDAYTPVVTLPCGGADIGSKGTQRHGEPFGRHTKRDRCGNPRPLILSRALFCPFALHEHGRPSRIGSTRVPPHYIGHPTS
jgi:hypothetical protein